jgi:DNA-binding response OmpR family regulator
MTELTAMLLRTHGFSTSTTNSARDAIRIVRETSPQAMILDLMMPEMDGRDVCKAIREFSNVPIIILSALNDPDIVASALDGGADDYLVKPVPSDVLVAHINRFIKRTGSLRPRPETISNAWTHPLTAAAPAGPLPPI